VFDGKKRRFLFLKDKCVGRCQSSGIFPHIYLLTNWHRLWITFNTIWTSQLIFRVLSSWKPVCLHVVRLVITNHRLCIDFDVINFTLSRLRCFSETQTETHKICDSLSAFGLNFVFVLPLEKKKSDIKLPPAFFAVYKTYFLRACAILLTINIRFVPLRKSGLSFGSAWQKIRIFL